MNNKLINLANYLDESGFKVETDRVSVLIKTSGKLSDAIQNNPDMEKQIEILYAGVKPGHFDWALEELLDGNATAQELITTILRFQRVRGNLDKKDLYQYPAINRLRKAVEEYGKTSGELKSEKDIKRFEESDLIYNSDNFRVVWPKTEFASCEWGKNTKWCVSAKESNMYNKYSNDNIFLYFVINKSLPDKDAHKRIAMPTIGDLGILKSELRDSLDEGMSVEEAQEAIGKEYDAISEAILNHSSKIGFTDNVDEETKSVARKIKNKEEIDVKELSEIFKIIEHADSNDSYWATLIISSLGEHPNLAETIIKSNPEHKRVLMFSMEHYYEGDVGDASGFGLDKQIDIYLMDNYNISDEVKLEALRRFFSEDIDKLSSLFPKILNHMLKFDKGRKEIFEFITQGLYASEVGAAIQNLDDEMLLMLFNAPELMLGDRGALEEVGEALESRGVITRKDLSLKEEEWYKKHYSDEFDKEYQDEHSEEQFYEY